MRFYPLRILHVIYLSELKAVDSLASVQHNKEFAKSCH